MAVQIKTINRKQFYVAARLVFLVFLVLQVPLFSIEIRGKQKKCLSVLRAPAVNNSIQTKTPLGSPFKPLFRADLFVCQLFLGTLAASTRAAKILWEASSCIQVPSACHWIPKRNGWSGFSIASMTPSPAVAEVKNPGGKFLTAW